MFLPYCNVPAHVHTDATLTQYQRGAPAPAESPYSETAADGGLLTAMSAQYAVHWHRSPPLRVSLARAVRVPAAVGVTLRTAVCDVAHEGCHATGGCLCCRCSLLCVLGATARAATMVLQLLFGTGL